LPKRGEAVLEAAGIQTVQCSLHGNQSFDVPTAAKQQAMPDMEALVQRAGASLQNWWPSSALLKGTELSPRVNSPLVIPLYTDLV